MTSRWIHALALPAIVLFLGACAESNTTPHQLVAEAKLAREKGNYAAAIIHLKNALQKSPDHVEAHFLLGATYAASGNMSLAEADLERALELGYDRTLVIPVLGKALLMKGEFQKVLDRVAPSEEYPGRLRAELLTLRALASIGLGRRVEARAMLEEALAAQPEFADALLALARFAAADQRRDEASRLVERALTDDPRSVDGWVMKGDIARAKTDHKGALAAYRKALDLDRKAIPARQSMISLQIEAGEHDAARQNIDELRKLAPNHPLTGYLQALLEFRRQNVTPAREILVQVLKGAPNHIPSVLLMGAVEAALGSHEAAQTYLNRVLAQAPDDLYARKLLISALVRSGRGLRAIEMLESALLRAPKDVGLLVLAGEAHLQRNDVARAAQYFDKAARLDPKSAGARTGLGLSRMAAGETDRALADLESAARIDASDYRADEILVVWHLRRSNYDQAMKALATLEKKQPNNPLTYNLKAAVFLGKKDFAAARKNLEHALALRPAHVPSALNLARIDLQENNPSAARSRLESILKKDGNNVEALLALASLAPRIGAAPREAIGWLERAVDANPGSAQAGLALARALADSGDFKKALQAAQRAVAVSPENPELLDAAGSIQTAAGEHAQAAGTFGKVVRLRPNSPLALYRLANAQGLAGQLELAAASLSRALSLKPDFDDARAALAGVEIRLGRHAAAMKIAQEVRRRVPKSPVGHVIEGDVLMAQKRFAEAAKVYATALGMGKSSAIFVKLHAATEAAGNALEAASRLAQWLKESPEDAAVRRYAADASLSAGRYAAAIGHYEWLLRTQPENVSVLNNLAWVYMQVKDARALATAERAHKLRPDNTEVTDTLGWILTEQGNASRAVALLQKAVEAAPQVPVIRLHLAQALIKSGERAKARAELEHIESQGTKFAQKDEAMALLKQLRH